MIGNSALVLWKKALWHNKEMVTKYWSVLILSEAPPLSLLQLLYNVPSSVLFWRLVTGGVRMAFCWGRRLRNSSIPGSLHDFGTLQCCCVPEFLHQCAPSKLPYLLPLSFSFWKAGLLSVRRCLVFKFNWFALEHCLCLGLLMFHSMAGLFCPG